MARVRRLLLTLASGSALYSGMVPALGLGEISLHSALNQPLEAEIELLQIGDLGADEIKVRLASAEVFNRSGVDRFMFLNDLRFTPVLRGGQSLIRVASSKPVREPFLNFIVEVLRPGGSLLREYTLLIDPPGSSAYNPVAGNPVAGNPPGSTPAQPRYVESPAAARAEPPRPAAPPRSLPAATRGQRYRVHSGDSLWSIAGRLRDAGSQASQQALMSDIQALNPAAFIAADRNRLRLAAELLLPDSAVPDQAGVPQPAPTQGAAPAVAAAAEPAPAAEAAPEPQPLAAAQRAVDRELAENQELQAALGDLQTQLAQLQAQMSEKDRQLANIRAELEQQRRANGQPATPAPAPQEPAAPPASAAAAWPFWLSAGGLCLVLIGGIWMLRRRVAGREPQPYQPPQVRPDIQVPAARPAEAMPVAGALAQPAAPVVPARAPGVLADPLEGANIYIAYGQFGDALAALRKAVSQEPQRIDLRLRLFEVLGELGDAQGFFAQQARLLELGANPVQVERIGARYAHLQRPSESAEPALESPPNEAAEPTPLVQDDFQLNLDDLSLDADWDLVTPFQTDAPLRAKPQGEPEFDPAFRSDLRELPEVFELTVDKDAVSPFGDLAMPEAGDEEVLQEEFIDAFAVQEPGRGKPLESSLEHLAGNREHLAQLNLALAYIEQGNVAAACDILNVLIEAGDDQERAQARELLAQIA